MRRVETKRVAVVRCPLPVTVVGMALAVFAMCGGTKAGAQASPGNSSVTSAISPDAQQLQAGAKILSDTTGVDFSGYVDRVNEDIQRSWDSLIPQEAQAPERKKGVVGIRIAILPDGTIGSIKLETTSKDVELDKAAWYAITSVGKFPALPSGFHGSQIDLRIGFFYNTPSSSSVSQPQAGAPQ